jgi:hypothetical protein
VENLQRVSGMLLHQPGLLSDELVLSAEEASLLAESGSIALPGKEEYDPDTTLFGIKGRENDIWKNIKQTMVGPPRSSGSITPTDLETILPSCESSLDE